MFRKIKGKKVVVTGGAGFIGSHLVDRLVDLKALVVVVDNFTVGQKDNINKRVLKVCAVDIREANKLKSCFKDADYVFHLAAIPRVPFSVADPITTTEVNILGTVNVFYAAFLSKIKRVIFASSSSVYGDQKKLPLKETMEPKPISPYGLQKLTGEKFAKLFNSLYKLPVISLRYFNVYGPRIDFDSDYSLVLGKFLRLKKENKPL